MENLKDKQNFSENIKSNIYSALLVFQQSEWLVPKDANNPYFKSKYADLESVNKICRKALNQAGVVLTQLPIVKDGQAGCVTVLTHPESLTEIQNELLLPIAGKGDAQAIGSCITYARRYSLCSLLGLVAAEEDDDGNSASGVTDKAPVPTAPTTPKGTASKATAPKTYPLKKGTPASATSSLKTPLSEDNIPEEYTNPEVNPSKEFPDSTEIVIRFKYDIDHMPQEKINKAMHYIGEMKQQGYVDLDDATGIIESSIELPLLERYRVPLGAS